MFGSYFAQQTLNGLAIGVIYGLIALGFSMVYQAIGGLNFCHAMSVTIGAMLSYMLIVQLGLPVWLSFFIIVAALFIYGWLVNSCFFRFFNKGSKIVFMLVSISLSGVLQQISLIIWGPEARALPNIFGTGKLTIGSAVVPMSNFILLGISIATLILLMLFFNRTRFGLAMRIAAENPVNASLMGVNVSRTYAATFSISAALGGVAGFLVAPLYGVTISLGQNLALKVFVAAVVGGVGYLPGAVGAGLLVGVLESLTSAYISSGWKDVIVFAAGILILAFRPIGIFRKAVTKH